MSCIALPIAAEEFGTRSGPGSVCTPLCKVPPRCICSGARILLPLPVSPRAPRRESQAAPVGTAVLCFGFAALRVLVPPAARAPSKKAHLGTWERPSLASVPAECPE